MGNAIVCAVLFHAFVHSNGHIHAHRPEAGNDLGGGEGSSGHDDGVLEILREEDEVKENAAVATQLKTVQSRSMPASDLSLLDSPVEHYNSTRQRTTTRHHEYKEGFSERMVLDRMVYDGCLPGYEEVRLCDLHSALTSRRYTVLHFASSAPTPTTPTTATHVRLPSSQLTTLSSTTDMKGCAHWRDYQLEQQQLRRQLRSTPNRNPSWIQAAARATELFGGAVVGQQAIRDK